MFSVRKSLDDAKRLVKLENLDLNILFDLLDEDTKQFVTTRDVNFVHQVAAFLGKHELPANDRDSELVLEALVNDLDVDNDGKVSFKDFYMFFTM
jgi:Ca2+-binding EF-hand superfamily protein